MATYHSRQCLLIQKFTHNILRTNILDRDTITQVYFNKAIIVFHPQRQDLSANIDPSGLEII